MSILSVLLIVQAVVFYTLSRGENVPEARPLSAFAPNLGDWQMTRDIAIEKDVQDVLRADDVLSRVYVDSGRNRGASLFVAFFRSQRAGQAPHSPKNCLPGNGWIPSVSDVIPVSIPSESEPIRINRYLVARGDERSVVLYWYQAHNRVIASEYTAKFYVVADAVRMNRTDTALVRVVVPVANNDEHGATEAALDFVRAFFTPLKSYLPS